MNKLFKLPLLLFSLQVSAQSEFETYKNGLIYSENTMQKLERIVDSLNLRYRTCDMNKVYYSKYQTVGHIVRLDSYHILKAKADMDRNMPFDSLVSKYPKAKVEKNVLIVKYQYKDYDDKMVVEYSEVDLNNPYSFEIKQENEDGRYGKDVRQTWIYDYQGKSEYSNSYIQAFYFPGNFKSEPLSMKYNRQIGYADCLIDTTSTKFLENAESGWVDLPNNWRKLSHEKQDSLLQEMRSTRVVGGCSMDSRPREHAVNIALLSAETTNWEVFLKSHLDIMNDRFERVSDGSYAYAQRKTYIRELEMLDINVQDLLTGITLRVENPANNHYYGSIGRLGRAITESNDKQAFENQMLAMIEDNTLDDYNRVLAYFLFISYNNYLENATERKENLEQVRSSIDKLPDYLKEKIKLKE